VAGDHHRYDSFISRRSCAADISREVASVLTESGYEVFVQDYDFFLGASTVERMHEGIKEARDMIILFTRDYLQSPYTVRSSRALRCSGQAAWEKGMLSFSVARMCPCRDC